MSWKAEWAIERMPTQQELTVHVQAIAAAAQLPAPAVLAGDDDAEQAEYLN
jgi:hypothetical protein